MDDQCPDRFPHRVVEDITVGESADCQGVPRLRRVVDRLEIATSQMIGVEMLRVDVAG
jgi:hypothetical protein